jgi:hypothetical protein
MLTLFPQILFLSPLAPTLLRFAAGIVFFQIAWELYEKRDELSRMKFIVVGKGAWVPLFSSLVAFLTGVGLVLGIYTQAAAIVGAAFALKSFVWHPRYPRFFTMPRTVSALLFIICLSLILTGAGAFAFDLPL